MARLLIIRHGQSTWNAEGRWQGQADPPLSTVGVEQAERAAASLSGLGFTSVVASDLERAQRTGELIAARLDLGPAEIDGRLRERDVGDWSGARAAEIHERWPGQLEAWREGKLERPPNGERDTDMGARVDAVLRDLSARRGVILVVTHGGVIHYIVRSRGGSRFGTGNLGGWWLEEGLVLGDAHEAVDAPTNTL